METPPTAATPPSAPASAEPARYAGFWIRLLGAVIDSIVIAVASFVAALPFGALDAIRSATTSETGVPTTAHPGANLAGFVIGLVYTVGTMVYWHGTLGMRLLNLRVTDLEGRPIGAGRAVGRYFAAYLSGCLCLVGYLVQPFTARRQTLHDLIAGTLVIHD